MRGFITTSALILAMMGTTAGAASRSKAASRPSARLHHGMNKEEIVSVMGEPDEVRAAKGYTQNVTVWVYHDRSCAPGCSACTLDITAYGLHGQQCIRAHWLTLAENWF